MCMSNTSCSNAHTCRRVHEQRSTNVGACVSRVLIYSVGNKRLMSLTVAGVAMYQRPIMIACEDSVEAVVVLESSAGTNICAVSRWWIERSRDDESVIQHPRLVLIIISPTEYKRQSKGVHSNATECGNTQARLQSLFINHLFRATIQYRWLQACTASIAPNAMHCFRIAHTCKASKGPHLNHRGAMHAASKAEVTKM